MKNWEFPKRLWRRDWTAEGRKAGLYWERSTGKIWIRYDSSQWDGEGGFWRFCHALWHLLHHGYDVSLHVHR